MSLLYPPTVIWCFVCCFGFNELFCSLKEKMNYFFRVRKKERKKTKEKNMQSIIDLTR